MRWEQIEFILKGVYLGLLLVVALEAPAWWQVGVIALYTVGMLALCVGGLALLKLREGYRVRGRLLGFILFLILENPRAGLLRRPGRSGAWRLPRALCGQG